MFVNNCITNPTLLPTPPNVCERLIEFAGNVTGEHILVIGHDMPAILADLTCRGAAEVVLLGPNAQPEADTVDLVLVSKIASIDYAIRAVAIARHALVGTGRIALRLLGKPAGGLVDGVTRLLRDHDFSAIRLRNADDSVIACATLSLSGSSTRR